MRLARRLLLAGGALATRGLVGSPLRRTWIGQRLYLGLYLTGKLLSERRERALLRALVRPGTTVLDVGANVGAYALPMARWLGPTGRLLAFEPDPFSYGLLAARARRARHRNVVAFPLALADRPGRGVLRCGLHNRADNRLGPAPAAVGETVGVEIATGDSICRQGSGPPVAGIKIDVQGAEVAVLSGLVETVRRDRPDWLFVEFSPEHLRGFGSAPEALWELAGSLGYRAEEVRPDGPPRAITDFAAYTARIGAGYGDLVLRPEMGKST